jgi:hypothetical protein
MTSKQRKAFGRFLLTIARSCKTMHDAGTFGIAAVYKHELEKIEKAAMETVEALRDGSKDEG